MKRLAIAWLSIILAIAGLTVLSTPAQAATTSPEFIKALVSALGPANGDISISVNGVQKVQMGTSRATSSPGGNVAIAIKGSTATATSGTGNVATASNHSTAIASNGNNNTAKATNSSTATADTNRITTTAYAGNNNRVTANDGSNASAVAGFITPARGGS